MQFLPLNQFLGYTKLYNFNFQYVANEKQYNLKYWTVCTINKAQFILCHKIAIFKIVKQCLV